MPEFNRRVYAIARTIPPGQTMTYGEIAERLGDKLLAREVGQALGQKPDPIIMPCHRVLAAARQDRRLLGPRRRGDQTAPADHRRRAARRPDFVRPSAVVPRAASADRLLRGNSPDPLVARAVHRGKQQAGEKVK